MKDEKYIKTKKSKHEIDMVNGPILSKMLMFALPVMAASILQLLFNAADIIVVGRFAGDDSLAAVGSTSSLVHLMVNLFVGLSIGANVMTARYFGAQKGRELNETLHTAITLSLVSGIFLAVIGVIIAEPVLIMMKSPDDVLVLAVRYLRIYFLGMPAMMVYNFGSAILRARGDTKRPLYFLAIAGVINVALNLFFVIKLDMNVAGVAAATTISQVISAAMIIICLTREEGDFRLEARKLRIHKQRLLNIMQVGLPAGFQGMLFSISNVLIQSSINTFGDTVIAGNSAAANIENFVYFAMNAFYQAAISFTSQNMGAGKYERINPVMKRALGCVIVTGLILGISGYIAGPALLGIYSKSSAVIAAGMIRMLFVCAPYALCGMMEVMVGMLRGMGYSIVPMIVSLIGACLSRIIWITLLFAVVADPPIQMIYISYPVTWALTLLAHVVYYVWIMKHKIRPMMEAKKQRELQNPANAE